MLREAGLARGRITFRDDRRAGQVIAQDPKPDTEVAKGSPVDLVLGPGKTERTKVPDLTDRTLTEAQRELESVKLQLGETEGPRTAGWRARSRRLEPRSRPGPQVSIVLTRHSGPQ